MTTDEKKTGSSERTSKPEPVESPMAQALDAAIREDLDRSTPQVSRTLLERAEKLDRLREPGRTTPGSEIDVMVVTQALVSLGYLSEAGEGAYDRVVTSAVAEAGGLEQLAEAAGFILID